MKENVLHYRITDWDSAYANGANIAKGERWPDAWVGPARAYREELGSSGRAKFDVVYGQKPRNTLDIFHPSKPALGLVVFVHGGFWVNLDKSYWSHFARGAIERGYAVAMPSYTLAPEARIGQITIEVAQSIELAAREVDGSIYLIGHSAGGHLVTRMITTTSPLSEGVQKRIVNTVSLSGLHDLRPLMNLSSNAKMRIDRTEAYTESPALLEPFANTRLVCWAGAAERAEFVRQNALLANIWKGLGAQTLVVEEPDKHHFSILDGLEDPSHPLMDALVL
ncbi:alpha/beta hydrolase [Agrobacterium sp. B1(2019)]|uniref:alpha/beta hydrolase n=1 Tax=Agrobacterium sp. B1(2019) TaxID=2607032 RepID=UPI0011F01CE1|nr:alpha/beta hydrolase [Agrobacterium sp. B1(2019)]TZG32153.1 alpha/beta hydrolase [Agrobacterium sp. B1(2019)]